MSGDHGHRDSQVVSSCFCLPFGEFAFILFGKKKKKLTTREITVRINRRMEDNMSGNVISYAAFVVVVKPIKLIHFFKQMRIYKK